MGSRSNLTPSRRQGSEQRQLDPGFRRDDEVWNWIAAFAGMTKRGGVARVSAFALALASAARTAALFDLPGVPIGRGEAVKEKAPQGARAWMPARSLQGRMPCERTSFTASRPFLRTMRKKARSLGRPLLGYFLWTSRESDSFAMDGERNHTRT